MLYCIVGDSGAGKNTLMEKLLKLDSNNLKRIVTATTRPIRPGEIPCKDYHFITESIAVKLIPNAIEARRYKIDTDKYWYYLTPDYCLSKNIIAERDYICVTAPEQFGAYFKAFRGYVVPIVLKVSDKTRLIRALSREEDPNCKEICRRFIEDHDKYNYTDIDSRFVYYNDCDNINELVKEVFYNMRKSRSDSKRIYSNSHMIPKELLEIGEVFGSLRYDKEIPPSIIKDTDICLYEELINN